MKKKSQQTRLSISKDTVRRLSDTQLQNAAGGMQAGECSNQTYCGGSDCLLCPRWAQPSY
jgi:hypothetical protein